MWRQCKPRHLLWLVPAVLVAVTLACGDRTVSSPTAATGTTAGSGTTTGSGTTPGASPAGTGTLKVMIKDSPFTDASAVLVTFSEVSVHTSGDAWVKLPFVDKAGNVDPTVTSRTCDLKRLVDAQDVLGVGKLTAGHYTQLRLTVDSATIYFKSVTDKALPPCTPDLAVLPLDPVEKGISVEVPSGILKLNREFTLADSTATTTTILLDFDGNGSIHQTGNGKYMMTPVIGVVSVQ